MSSKTSVLPESLQPANYKRESYNGYGNGLARAFELTVTPALFGFIGHLIDRATGTGPGFMVALVIFAIVGMFIKLWFGYDHEMKHHESQIGRATTFPSVADESPSSGSAR